MKIQVSLFVVLTTLISLLQSSVTNGFLPPSPLTSVITERNQQRSIHQNSISTNSLQAFLTPNQNDEKHENHQHHHHINHHHQIPSYSKAFQTLTTSILIFATVSSSAAYAESSSLDPTILNGDYADPFHPQCERHIQVNKDKKSFHYSGTAVGPKDDPIRRGCSLEEQQLYGLRQGAFDGLIAFSSNNNDDEKDFLSISAGDGIHEGVWEDKNVKVKGGMTGGGIDGIRWNDGNKWTKLESSSLSLSSVSESAVKKEDSVGELFGKWVFVLYTVFSLLAGAKEMVVRFQNRNTN